MPGSTTLPGIIVSCGGDTGNDQEDYENVRDQVEWLVDSRPAALEGATT